MPISDTDLAELLPESDAEKALLRMSQEERLPKYKENSLLQGLELSGKLKEAIRSAGSPEPVD